jgi:hypothetical protein
MHPVQLALLENQYSNPTYGNQLSKSISTTTKRPIRIQSSTFISMSLLVSTVIKWKPHY